MQRQSLTSLQLGYIGPSEGDFVTNRPGNAQGYAYLGEVLAGCEHLEEFRWECDQRGSLVAKCDQGMKLFADMVYSEGMRGSWRKTLKVSFDYLTP